MLSNSSERETGEKTVYPCSGTSALSPMTAEESAAEDSPVKKHRRNRSRQQEATYSGLPAPEPEPKTEPQLLPQTEPEESVPQDAPPQPLPLPPEEAPPEAEPRTVYYPMGTEYVRTDSELPQADNHHTLPDASGIIYEIAEELYRKEKTASEIEALCQPPFRKVFNQKQIEELERQAQERTIRLLSATNETNRRQPVEGVASKEEKPITTASAFLMQLMLLVPVLNIAAAFVFSFGRGINRNLRAYSRGFLIWFAIGMTGALLFFAVSFYSNPLHYADLMRFLSLFSG